MTARILLLWLLQGDVPDTIAIESEGLAPELLQIVVEGCSEAQGPGLCRAADDAGPSPTWYARITWEDADRLRVRVEVRRGARDAELEAVRVVEFSPTDDLAQRHRAVGLIVASYVAERSDAREEEPVQEPEPPPLPPEPSAQAAVQVEPVAPEPPTEPQAAGLDLALVTGPGFDEAPWRVGLSLRGFVRPQPWPLAPTAALRATRSEGEATLLWLSGSLGLLGRLEQAGLPLALEARAELVAERLLAEARDRVSGERDESGLWRLGGRLGLELHLELGSGFGLFAGGDLGLLWPSVSLHVGGQAVGEAGKVAAAGLIGVRFAR